MPQCGMRSAGRAGDELAAPPRPRAADGRWPRAMARSAKSAQRVGDPLERPQPGDVGEPDEQGHAAFGHPQRRHQAAGISGRVGPCPDQGVAQVLEGRIGAVAQDGRGEAGVLRQAPAQIRAVAEDSFEQAGTRPARRQRFGKPRDIGVFVARGGQEPLALARDALLVGAGWPVGRGELREQVIHRTDRGDVDAATASTAQRRKVKENRPMPPCRRARIIARDDRCPCPIRRWPRPKSGVLNSARGTSPSRDLSN